MQRGGPRGSGAQTRTTGRSRGRHNTDKTQKTNKKETERNLSAFTAQAKAARAARASYRRPPPFLRGRQPPSTRMDG